MSCVTRPLQAPTLDDLIKLLTDGPVDQTTILNILTHWQHNLSAIDGRLSNRILELERELQNAAVADHNRRHAEWSDFREAVITLARSLPGEPILRKRLRNEQ